MADAMKLVVDNSNVEQFPGVNLGDVRLAMEAVAKRIEAGDFGDVRNGILVLETDNGIESFHWGALTQAIEAIGLLDMAKTAIALNHLAGEA
jgi:hypothetical protein